MERREQQSEQFAAVARETARMVGCEVVHCW
jgi:hypothetical protein